jgi:hypothetical protein
MGIRAEQVTALGKMGYDQQVSLTIKSKERAILDSLFGCLEEWASTPNEVHQGEDGLYRLSVDDYNSHLYKGGGVLYLPPSSKFQQAYPEGYKVERYQISGFDHVEETFDLVKLFDAHPELVYMELEYQGEEPGDNEKVVIENGNVTVSELDWVQRKQWPLATRDGLNPRLRQRAEVHRDGQRRLSSLGRRRPHLLRVQRALGGLVDQEPPGRLDRGPEGGFHGRARLPSLPQGRPRRGAREARQGDPGQGQAAPRLRRVPDGGLRRRGLRPRRRHGEQEAAGEGLPRHGERDRRPHLRGQGELPLHVPTSACLGMGRTYHKDFDFGPGGLLHFGMEISDEDLTAGGLQDMRIVVTDRVSGEDRRYELKERRP